MATLTMPKPGATITSSTDVLGRPKYERAARVCVWKNAETLGLPNAKHPGHAAMQLFEGDQVKKFVSWWPGDGADKDTPSQDGKGTWRLSWDGTSELGAHALQHLQSGDIARTGQYYHVNINRWVKLPDVAVDLPGMGAQGVRWGLHLPSIAIWWTAWSKDQYYVMKSTTNNCAGAVALGLKQGGAECFVPQPFSFLVLPPNAIASWAQKLQNRLWDLELKASRMNRKVNQAGLDYMNAGSKLQNYSLPGPMPSLAEWKKATFMDYKPRSSALRAIDSALDAYYKELAGAPVDSGFKIERLRLLVRLFEAIYYHVLNRPNSERRMWVLSLAGRTLLILNSENAASLATEIG